MSRADELRSEHLFVILGLCSLKLKSTWRDNADRVADD